MSVSDADGDTVDGALDATGASWTTSSDLFPGTHYLVTATAVDAAGKTTDESTSFTTAAAPHVLGVKIAPLEGETVGVGMPIVVYFSAAVTNKAAVEKALTVEMSEPVDGAWHWYGTKEVHFRPAQYWPAGEQVTLHADLKGVDAGKGVWGTEDRTLNFSVGDSHIADVDAKLHTMTVYVNGKVARVADGQHRPRQVPHDVRHSRGAREVAQHHHGFRDRRHPQGQPRLLLRDRGVGRPHLVVR